MKVIFLAASAVFMMATSQVFAQESNNSAASEIKVGNQAPEFSQAAPNGKEISLEDYKGKYVLIDFWASWCGPCRAENPNVVKAYQQFKNKNFDILGVSLDTKKDKWLEAIAKDKLEWQHVSDLKGWENKVSELYKIEGIPANFLVNPDGKIIAKDLRGYELTDFLEKILTE